MTKKAPFKGKAGEAYAKETCDACLCDVFFGIVKYCKVIWELVGAFLKVLNAGSRL